MKILWIIVLFAFLAAAVEAKRKRKFEGDFEFAEEVSLTVYSSCCMNRVHLLHFTVYFETLKYCQDSSCAA